jgi:transcriptional regulator with XRE-family HTH domain
MKGLRRWRLRRNLTQEDLADMTDLSQRTVSMIENGRQRPRAKTLERLVEALDVETRTLDPKLAAASYEPQPRRKMPDKIAKGIPGSSRIAPGGRARPRCPLFLPPTGRLL